MVAKKQSSIAEDDGFSYICGICRDFGELICCEKCGQGFHLECLGYKSLPNEDPWFCNDCKDDKVFLKLISICIARCLCCRTRTNLRTCMGMGMCVCICVYVCMLANTMYVCVYCMYIMHCLNQVCMHVCGCLCTIMYTCFS